MSLALRYAALSHVGKIREGNEDSAYANDRLLVVADGMGGHAAGELASSAAVATLAQAALMPSDDPGSSMREAVYLAEEKISEFIDDDPSMRGMGTTLTALGWVPPHIILAHVGDSRAYRWRITPQGGALTQLTRDHTYVQTLVDAGELTPEAALTHPRRNLLTKALDGVHHVEPDIYFLEAQEGDRFLLCSDGLCGVVPEETINTILASANDLVLAVDLLVEEALKLGAPDNVTVVLADAVDLSGTDSETLIDMRQGVVVGAAREPRNRMRLPGVVFPSDVDTDFDLTNPDGIPSVRPASDATPDAAQQGTATSELPRQSAPRSRFRLWRGLIGAITICVLAAFAAGIWLSNQWYVGALGGSVAVYQGVPQTLFGLHLSRSVESSTVTVENLPIILQRTVIDGISAESRSDAARIVEELSISEESCKKIPVPAGCPGHSEPLDPALPTTGASSEPTAGTT